MAGYKLRACQLNSVEFDSDGSGQAADSKLAINPKEPRQQHETSRHHDIPNLTY